MVTYLALRDKSGLHTGAFEIDNIGNTPWWIARVLSRVDGVSDVRRRKPFSRTNSNDVDIRVRFRYLGHDFVVEEPYGDNSRYWIGPADPEQAIPDVTALENAFKRSESLFMKVFVDVCTLRPLRRVFHREHA